MNADFDAIVIGGGHNGLVAAAWLAKAGRKVLLLEKRAALGGIAANEELFAGFHFNTGAPDAGLLLPQVMEALNLQKHGLEFIDNAVAAFAPSATDDGLTLWRDPTRTANGLAKFSAHDADLWPKYLAQTQAFSSILAQMASLSPPALRGTPASLLWAWARLAFRVRGMGSGMMEFFRTLPMSAYQFLNEWFESEPLKGLLASVALTGLMQGPRASGTAFMLLYQQVGGSNGGFRSSRVLRGGMNRLVESLAKAARDVGAEIRTGAEVERIQASRGRVLGVQLKGGETISAKTVLSNADPRLTFLDLLGAPKLAPRISRRLRSLKLRGSTASIHLALNGLPDFPSAHGETQKLSGAIVICPSMDYAERAHDDAKYGRISANPILEARIPSQLDPSLAPAGKHSMSIIFRFAPYRLRESEWDSQRERLGDIAIKTLAQYSPNLESLISDRCVITPLDYERDYGLTEGSLFHGQMGLDQLLLMRPIPGFFGYRSPIEGLYLCGAGAHPGGGVTGAPGLNAARQAHREIS